MKISAQNITEGGGDEKGYDPLTEFTREELEARHGPMSYGFDPIHLTSAECRDIYARLKSEAGT